MKYIDLTKGLKATVDDNDYDYLSQFKWHASVRRYKSTHKVYAARKKRKEDGSWTNIYMHREIMGVLGKDVEIDHVDNDRLNNQKDNLRLCSGGDNMCNRGKQSNNKTGYKGVFNSNSLSSPWFAQIRINRKQIYLGRYKTKESAAQAYNDGAILYHGKYAKLNNI